MLQLLYYVIYYNIVRLQVFECSCPPCFQNMDGKKVHYVFFTVYGYAKESIMFFTFISVDNMRL